MAPTDSRTLTKHEQLTLVISSKEKESSGPRFQQLAYKTRHHYDCTPSVCFKKTEAFINFTGNYNIRATSKSSPLWWMQAPSAYFPVPHLFSFCLFPLKISILYIPKGVSFFFFHQDLYLLELGIISRDQTQYPSQHTTTASYHKRLTLPNIQAMNIHFTSLTIPYYISYITQRKC